MAEMSRNAEKTKIYSASPEGCHLDLRRRTSDFNGLLGSAYAQEESLDS